MSNKIDSIELLRAMVRIPSLSGEEIEVANLLSNTLSSAGVENIERQDNNVWAVNKHFNSEKPTILLCSHHDTVRPSKSYTVDPFGAEIVDVEGEKRIYGLGSNDAGGSVVGLLCTFLHFYNMENLNYNLCLALVGEEEISGTHGLRSIMEKLPKLDFAIVGEPTLMKMAVAERGLMVVDCVAKGKSGHAAREEGVNAIYKAVKDITWLQGYQFPKVSPLFGNVKMTATIIGAGTVHNVVPDSCTFTVDCRVSECYSLEEVLAEMQKNMESELTPRSMRLRPSGIPMTHSIVEAGLAMGLDYYGSPTTSDAAVLSPLPTLKLGIGDSARSHSADEYLTINELTSGIIVYKNLLSSLLLEA